jgi:peptidoglycan hydrolase-like protein with peptidoglycan-binding domain
VSHSDWFRRLASARAGRGPGRLRASRSVVVTAASAALVVIAGVAILAMGPGKAAKTTLRTTSVAESAPGQGKGSASTPAHKPAPALQVVSVTPASGTSGVDGTSPVRVQFSAPLAAGSPMPSLSPSVAGAWKREGDFAVFTPASGFLGSTNVTVSVPGGTSGARSAAGASAGAGGLLAASVSRSFTTAPFSTLRLQQLLAQLGYLPLTWTPGGAAIQPADTAAQLAAAYNPPSGSFSWQGGYPSQLNSFWQEGSANLIDTGAVRAFQSDAGLTMDGVAGPAVWSALLKAVAAGQHNTNGYTYALASKGSPETLTIWHDGRQVFQNAANTGIPVAPTADGTFPVYERLRNQIMQGTNPDGSHYSDPVQYVAYFNGGDAVHYFPRGSYGWPQSLGCVELPLGPAAVAWPYLTYGSLVTVTG